LLNDVIYYILTIGVRPLPDVTQHMTSFKLKHRLVHMWAEPAELDHRHIAAAIGQWWCRLNACDSCV